MNVPEMRYYPSLVLAGLAVADAFTLPSHAPLRALRVESIPQMLLSSSRRELLAGGLAYFALPVAQAAFAEEEAAPAAAPASKTVTLKSGMQYEVVKKGTGGTPKVGDLIAIRFKGAVKATGAVFDDIMSSPEPYYTRLGSGNVLPAVEEVLPLMRSGDVWDLTIPGKLGFGEKGRSASPGKPRIPGNAELSFTLELVAVPGKDDEILELGLGD